MAHSLAELAEQFGGIVHGDGACLIESVATLQSAVAGQISFLTNRRYQRYLASTQASAVILSASDLDNCSVNALVTDNPYLVYARIADLLNPAIVSSASIHPSAVVEATAHVDPTATIAANTYIGAGAHIGAGVFIGPGSVVEQNVSIGKNCRLVSNVSLCQRVILGERVLVQPGAVIGGDGFGFASDQGEWIKVPQLGTVIIGDDVEVGANTTIDRGALENTVIGAGVKLDNQIQIAHNVHIGDLTAIAAATAIAGSTHIGRRCQIGGAVGIVGHLTITDDVFITGMSLVTADIMQAGAYSSGMPLEENRKWRKNAVRIKRLDKMARSLMAIEKALEKNNITGND